MLLQGLLLIRADEPPLHGWLAVDRDRIVEIGEGEPPGKPDLVADSGSQPLIICPGFIDAHLHLPQVDSVGCDGMDLIDWLEQVIYPAEMRWSDEDIAAAQIRSAYARLVQAGTLGFAAFLTSHFHGYVHCVRTGYELPLRAIVGQSLMDRNAPAELLHQPLTRIATSARARVACSVNPRFAVSCSDALLEIASQKARADLRLDADDAAHVKEVAANPESQDSGVDLPLIHTHLAENLRECEMVRELFPNDPNYTAVYDRHGLLTRRTLLAHCLHLSDDEWDLIARRNSVIVHCPTANTFLKSGVFDLRKAKEMNVRLALGSDVAAGPDFSMPRVARAMIEVAKVRSMTIDPDAYIPTPAEAWTMITRSNADALGWHDAGRIAIGAAADLLVLRVPFEMDQNFFGRLIYTWRDDYIAKRIVGGALCKESRP